jgi:predicted nucleotidyltransferase
MKIDFLKERAKSFLRDANFAIPEKRWNLTAFYLGQACQLYLKYYLFIKKRKREKKYFKNYLFWTKKIKRVTKKLFGEVKVFIFGSILQENEIARDIDLLIVSQKFEDDKEKIGAKIKLQRKLGFSYPFEFHFVSPKEHSQWYRYFVKEKIEI